MAEIDESVRRVLTLKERLGVFDDPYRRGAIPEPDAAFAHRRQLARDVGARAIVMLKNDKAALPLIGSLRRLAVIGPLADAPAEMRGPWWGAADAEGHVSVVAGLRAVRPGSQVLHAPGVAIDDQDVSGMAAALHLCAAADAILLCLGEAATMSGEAASRAHMGLPGKQRQFAEAVLEKARAANKPVIVILFSGRPLLVPGLVGKADAVPAAGLLGSGRGNRSADGGGGERVREGGFGAGGGRSRGFVLAWRGIALSRDRSRARVRARRRRDFGGPLRGQSAVARRNREVILVAPLLSRRRSSERCIRFACPEQSDPTAPASGPILRFAGRRRDYSPSRK